jgi:hypothetical protein
MRLALLVNLLTIKALLSMTEGIGRLFLLVKGYSWLVQACSLNQIEEGKLKVVFPILL